MTTTSQTETCRIADLPEDDAQALMAAIYHNAERNMDLTGAGGGGWK